MKKSILITLIVVSLVVLGVVAYFLFFNNNQVPSDDNGASGFPESGESDRDQRGGGVEDFFSDIEDERGPEERGGITLKKITDRPVAGFSLTQSVLGTTTGETTTRIRFVERGTGHIYETTSETGVFERISNTTIAKARNSVWSDDGHFVLIQFEEDQTGNLKSFLAGVEENRTETEELDGFFMEDNLRSPVFSPSGTMLAYLVETRGGSEVRVFDTETEEVSVVFQSPVSEWVLSWPNEEGLVLTTSPSGISRGFSYKKPLGVGGFEKVVGGFFGLTTKVSPDNLVIFSAFSGNSVHLFQKRGGENINLSPDTLPEKCSSLDGVFVCGVPNSIPSGLYPDNWYKGNVSFNDSVWALYPNSGFSDLLYSEGGVFDVVKPQISDDGGLFLFVNKKDSGLWALSSQSGLIER